MSLRAQLSQLVYSTEQGRIEPEDEDEEKRAPEGDGIIRIRLETKGRKGKGVTTIHGLEGSEVELKAIAKELKKRCSVGGSLKDFVIEIQGDQRTQCKQWLEQQGYKVKLAGG
ncbi:MAG: stress response translation initiation inhibitor YciH [Idiomarina sp.]|nr:stress response translation initiation inhibitor YciH [Idiomarina sp.]